MTFSHKDISRIKNVKHVGQENGNAAYLDLTENRFVLHWPNKYKGGILNADVGEIIVVYQRIWNTPYYTHLVTPLDNELVEYVVDPNFRFGRYVKVIAYTGESGVIPVSEGPAIDLRNSFGSARELQKMLDPPALESYQVAIWRLFEEFMDPGLVSNPHDVDVFHNDELEADFPTAEGRRLFRMHRTYERDSRISVLKKEEARRNGNLKCEVCGFSFEQTYGQDYIECHHLVPIHTGERVTRKEDLALVCSNCHRMLHRKMEQDYLSIHELRQLLRSRRD